MNKIIALCAALSITGCAHFSNSQRPATPPAERKAAQTVSTNPNEDLFAELDQLLAKSRSERVTVPTALLKSLVRNGRIKQTQCKSTSEQLEAIKNVDLQETGERKQ